MWEGVRLRRLRAVMLGARSVRRHVMRCLRVAVVMARMRDAVRRFRARSVLHSIARAAVAMRRIRAVARHCLARWRVRVSFHRTLLLLAAGDEAWDTPSGDASMCGAGGGVRRLAPRRSFRAWAAYTWRAQLLHRRAEVHRFRQRRGLLRMWAARARAHGAVRIALTELGSARCAAALRVWRDIALTMSTIRPFVRRRETMAAAAAFLAWRIHVDDAVRLRATDTRLRQLRAVRRWRRHTQLAVARKRNACRAAEHNRRRHLLAVLCGLRSVTNRARALVALSRVAKARMRALVLLRAVRRWAAVTVATTAAVAAVGAVDRFALARTYARVLRNWMWFVEDRQRARAARESAETMHRVRVLRKHVRAWVRGAAVDALARRVERRVAVRSARVVLLKWRKWVISRVAGRMFAAAMARRARAAVVRRWRSATAVAAAEHQAENHCARARIRRAFAWWSARSAAKSFARRVAAAADIARVKHCAVRCIGAWRLWAREQHAKATSLELASRWRVAYVATRGLRCWRERTAAAAYRAACLAEGAARREVGRAAAARRGMPPRPVGIGALARSFHRWARVYIPSCRARSDALDRVRSRVVERIVRRPFCMWRMAAAMLRTERRALVALYVHTKTLLERRRRAENAGEAARAARMTRVSRNVFRAWSSVTRAAAAVQAQSRRQMDRCVRAIAAAWARTGRVDAIDATGASVRRLPSPGTRKSFTVATRGASPRSPSRTLHLRSAIADDQRSPAAERLLLRSYSATHVQRLGASSVAESQDSFPTASPGAGRDGCGVGSPPPRRAVPSLSAAESSDKRPLTGVLALQAFERNLRSRSPRSPPSRPSSFPDHAVLESRSDLPVSASTEDHFSYRGFTPAASDGDARREIVSMPTSCSLPAAAQVDSVAPVAEPHRKLDESIAALSSIGGEFGGPGSILGALAAEGALGTRVSSTHVGERVSSAPGAVGVSTMLSAADEEAPSTRTVSHVRDHSAVNVGLAAGDVGNMDTSPLAPSSVLAMMDRMIGELGRKLADAEWEIPDRRVDTDSTISDSATDVVVPARVSQEMEYLSLAAVVRTDSAPDGLDGVGGGLGREAALVRPPSGQRGDRRGRRSTMSPRRQRRELLAAEGGIAKRPHARRARVGNLSAIFDARLGSSRFSAVKSDVASDAMRKRGPLRMNGEADASAAPPGADVSLSRRLFPSDGERDAAAITDGPMFLDERVRASIDASRAALASAGASSARVSRSSRRRAKGGKSTSNDDTVVVTVPAPAADVVVEMDDGTHAAGAGLSTGVSLESQKSSLAVGGSGDRSPRHRSASSSPKSVHFAPPQEVGHIRVITCEGSELRAADSVRVSPSRALALLRGGSSGGRLSDVVGRILSELDSFQ